MVELPCETIQDWTSACWECIINSISLLEICLFRLCISSWFSLGRSYVSRNFSVSFRLSNLLAYNHSYDSIIFCIPMISIVISFHFSFFYLGFLFLFFWRSLTKDLSIYLSFHKTNSWFHWSFLFFISILFISSLVFIIASFCWLWALFDSSNSFTWLARVSIWEFCFLR